jgi:hypothetical protein
MVPVILPVRDVPDQVLNKSALGETGATTASSSFSHENNVRTSVKINKNLNFFIDWFFFKLIIFFDHLNLYKDIKNSYNMLCS